MQSESWVEKYNQINNSFKEQTVFRFGGDSGFFSEYNNMILAILYCLKNKIKFVLSSQYSLFALEKGWADFFLPFVEENNKSFNEKLNHRSYRFEQDFDISQYPSNLAVLKERVYRVGMKYKAKLYKRFEGIDYLTQDLWNEYRDKNIVQQQFHVPELGLCNSPLLEATQIVINNIWTYTPEVEKAISSYKNRIKIPGEYISIHIRSGDKFVEADLYGIEKYISLAEKFTPAKRAFILTDDYTVIEQLRNCYKDWEFYTLCDSTERGYFHREFNQLDKNYKFNQHLKLFASLDICSSGTKFIGTYSSNPGMYMGMRKGEEFCYGVDFNSWQLW